MNELTYTDVEIRKDEDGCDVKYVYVPAFDEWMTEDEFAFQKACYDPAMTDARAHEIEHGCEDFCPNDDWDDDVDDDDDWDDDDWDDDMPKTKEEALERYNRTGINHSEFDLNDYDDINRRLGFEFIKTKK